MGNGSKRWNSGRREEMGSSTDQDLNDMVSEISFLSFLSGSVFHIEDADEIGCPASHQAIEQLE